VTPAERDALVARIVACRAHFSGTTLVPYSDRHRITKPPMSGAPEAPLALLADVRAFLEGLEL
jgi:hypothetical protein